jgi:hypothetical protein
MSIHRHGIDAITILIFRRVGGDDQGYEPKDRDRHDMAQLRAAFGLDRHF